MKCKYCNNIINENNEYCTKCGNKTKSIKKYFDFVSILSINFILLFFIIFLLVNIYSFHYFSNQDVAVQSGIIIIGGLSVIIYGIISIYYILLFIINFVFKNLESTAKIIKNIIFFTLEIIPVVLILYLILTGKISL